MPEFFDWLSSNTLAANVFIAVVSILVIGITTIYTGAFFQGREISFWPPRIGPIPHEKKQLNKNDNTLNNVGAESLEVPSLMMENNTNGNIGYGITIGGRYSDISLEVVTSKWEKYYNSGVVKSGWLFNHQTTESLAISFFKIHLQDNGKGIIYIHGSANPTHSVWLKTSTKFYREQEFCWNEKPDVQKFASWSFNWKE